MRVKPSGPVPADIMIVGEAPGKTESDMGLPFVGASGQELRRMLREARLDPAKIYLTNVFMDQPPGNDIKAYCAKKTVVGKSYPLPPLSTGNYVKPEYLFELDRLRQEILEVQPKIVIAVGNTPCWALLERTGISKLRGSIFQSTLCDVPVLPTYHPAAILRDWSLRTISMTDLLKAGRFIEGEINPIRRELWLAPTQDEVHSFIENHIFGGPLPGPLSFDIETFGGTITCIGFAPTIDRAITIPFFDPKAADKNYWPSAKIEKEIFLQVKRVLESPLRKLGQNGLYDIQYCYWNGIRVQNYFEDTMIKHHSLYPEMDKGLGFLASVYTDEAPWKVLRDRNRDNFKLDDE